MQFVNATVPIFFHRPFVVAECADFCELLWNSNSNGIVENVYNDNILTVNASVAVLFHVILVILPEKLRAHKTLSTIKMANFRHFLVFLSPPLIIYLELV